MQREGWNSSFFLTEYTLNISSEKCQSKCSHWVCQRLQGSSRSGTASYMASRPWTLAPGVAWRKITTIMSDTRPYLYRSVLSAAAHTPPFHETILSLYATLTAPHRKLYMQIKVKVKQYQIGLPSKTKQISTNVGICHQYGHGKARLRVCCDGKMMFRCWLPWALQTAPGPKSLNINYLETNARISLNEGRNTVLLDPLPLLNCCIFILYQC